MATSGGAGERGGARRHALAAAFSLPLLVAAPLPAPAQQPAQRSSRTCVIHVDSAPGGTQIVKLPDGTQNVFSGGGVWARCLNQPTTITADSMAYTEVNGLLRFIGHVHFRDSTAILDADQTTYWIRQERLFAEGNVYTRNLATGSEMRGPNLDYYRAVPSIRDTLEIYATGRPLIHLYEEQDSLRADTAEPFVVRTDRARMRGQRALWGSGNVTIDRSDLAARGDSAFINLADSFALLIGAPVVTAKDATPGHDSVSYRLTGQRIRFELSSGRQVRRVLSMGDADATGPDWRLLADTLDLALDSSRIQRAQAWGRNERPRAHSDLSTIVADSLDIHMPGQVMEQVLAYGRARATSRPDSAQTEYDWLDGDSLRARFAAADSAGRRRSEIRQVIAFGGGGVPARAYYHVENDRDPAGQRGINYSRGRRINIAMRERKVRTVDIVGLVDGVYLEPLPPGWDTIAVDTAAAGTVPPSRGQVPGTPPPAPGTRPPTPIRPGGRPQ